MINGIQQLSQTEDTYLAVCSMTMEHDEDTIRSIAQQMLGCNMEGSGVAFLRRFKAHFGVSPFIASCIWNRMLDENTLPTLKARPMMPKHLLWALMFLKLYSTEEVLCRKCGTTEKTFRRRVWLMLCSIATLDVVSYLTASMFVAGRLYLHTFFHRLFGKIDFYTKMVVNV
jgi:hypothetical protein